MAQLLLSIMRNFLVCCLVLVLCKEAPPLFALVMANDGVEANFRYQTHQQHQQQKPSPMMMIRSRRRLQQTTPRQVRLFLSLYYLDEENAVNLESMDPNNPMVAHFCESVNEQASGPQVEQAASALGVTIQTTVTTLPSGAADFGCEITDTNRRYDIEAYDIFGPGFFILELSVTQVVQVDSPSTLSDSRLYSLVETGYSRGVGGRVRFRSLLQNEPAFSTVLNVEVLPGTLSPPQAPPTMAPSPSPTASPSFAPTAKPTVLASMTPTRFSTSFPTVNPTDFPPTSGPMQTVTPVLSSTGAPTVFPTIIPVIVGDSPTVSPTNESGVDNTPTDSPTLDANIPLTADEDRQPLILGAIAGGLATILVSLFFIFCVWCPCKARDDVSTQEEQPPMGGVESGSSSQSDLAAAITMIPGVVNVSDENSSLADSTLGEQMANPSAKKPRLGEHSQPVPKPQQRHVQQQQPQQRHVQQEQQQQQQQQNASPPVTAQDSFDDSSLYTSGTEPEKASQTQNMVITKLLPDSLNNTLDYEDDIIFPMSGSGSESEGEKESTSKSVATTPRAKSSIDMSESTRRISNVGGNFGDDTDDSSFMCSSPVESDEERAMAISRMIDRNTKGFDPFADDDDSSGSSSSFAFDKVEPVDGGMIFGHPKNIRDDSLSPSNTTTSTKDVERMLLGSMRTSETHTAGNLIVQDHLDSPGSRSSDGSPNSKRARGRSSVSKLAASEDRNANNKLLRSVLEDARSLSENKSPTGKSHSSRQSAPPSFNNYHESERNFHGNGDILADHFDFKADKNGRGRRKSSMSVGAPPIRRELKDKGDYAASLPPRSPTETSKIAPKKHSTAGDSTRSHDSASLNEGHRPYRTRYLESLAKPQPRHLIPPTVTTVKHKDNVESDTTDSEDDALAKATSGSKEGLKAAPQSPSSTSTDIPMSPSGYLGAEPRDRDHVWSITSEDSVMQNSEGTGTDTPMSSPGVLGIAGKNAGRILKDDSSVDSDGLSNPWLFDVMEQTLGPRSAGADMESISGRSSRSGRSHRSGRSSRRSRSRQRNRAARSSSSTRSHSRMSRDGRTESPSSSRVSRGDPSSATNESIEMALEPKNLEHGLKRLQLQLSDVLNSEMDKVAGSTISVSTAGEAEKQKKKNKKKRKVVVVVPPGKLGIVLANRQDGRGTIVAEVRHASVMRGSVIAGDRIVGVDEKDVANSMVNEITNLMSSRANAQRRLTFVRTFYTAEDAGEDR